MSDAPTQGLRRRVLLLLPTSRDVDITLDLLERSGIAACVCADGLDLLRELTCGAGALLVAEECLSDGTQGLLARYIEAQPRWSDLPVVLLTRGGANSLDVGDAVAMLGNVTLLERPLRVTALVSTLHSALRARHRQYEIQSHLQELETARDAEMIAARRKDEFLAMLAHELRNPLAPIRNALHVLAIDDGDVALRQDLRAMMGRQVDHMVRLVDDLLEASRLSRGMITLHPEALDLCAAVRAAIELNRPGIEAHEYTINLELCEQGLMVDADPVRIAQVFGNLLNNAVKYGRPRGNITVRGRREADTAVVEVVDDGIGIASADLPHVFDLFVQGQGDADRMHEGLGIGLALVRTLVQLHGGTVTADSAGKDAGASFQVRLPLAQARAARAEPFAPDEPPIPYSPATKGAATGDRPGPYRVLVVDDNTDAATSLAMVLRTRGHELCIAHDGAEALAQTEAFSPHAVLLDIGMPGLDGYEVARRLREDPQHAAVVLIAITGWSRLQDRQRGRAAGFDHHFRKPVDLPRLCELLEELRSEDELTRET